MTSSPASRSMANSIHMAGEVPAVTRTRSGVTFTPYCRA